MFYECIHIKHASPSFLTKQLIVNFDYDTFNYENILYSWIETNEKVIANTELKNYIRGLFENFFPKIWDFILNNKYKKIEIEIYTFQDADIVTFSASGEVEGDETKYPIPDGWLNG